MRINGQSDTDLQNPKGKNNLQLNELTVIGEETHSAITPVQAAIMNNCHSSFLRNYAVRRDLNRFSVASVKDNK